LRKSIYGSPVTLENRLASDPNFFCELIQLTYRAKGEEYSRLIFFFLNKSLESPSIAALGRLNSSNFLRACSVSSSVWYVFTLVLFPLENRLASDPNFFCELIQLTYRAKGEESKENPSPKQRNIATNAYRLLSTWKIVPSTQAGGEFNPNTFTQWLSQTEKIVQAPGVINTFTVSIAKVGAFFAIHSFGNHRMNP
jgi:hypothetical protein